MSNAVFNQDLFKDKVAVVTGGTSGIGQGVAQYLAELGAKVYAVGLGSDKVSFPEGLNVEVREVDVTNDDHLKSLFAELDRLDILVPAAGISMGAKEMEWEAYNKVLSIQLQGVYRTINLAEDLLKANKRTVINIASMYSYFGGGTAVAYSSAKGGIVQLTKSLAEAWGKDGVRVNAVAPGWINTPLLSAVDDVAPGASERILSRTPAGRFGEPEEIASTIAFLASDAAAFVNGVTLPVDGGYLTVGI
ncbi:SDR family NAD(P)-dependent oxidoreductase [Corynebacterium lubricantis]|uniref:SDR family NAD(P)-dependent oxidoreductase n=1 Tax=Corynebacterium lubricantis TaxID=541095 RepID=UPI00035F7329|nr:SDR family oxidoreductase [Corynebacterium lubricantis]